MHPSVFIRLPQTRVAILHNTSTHPGIQGIDHSLVRLAVKNLNSRDTQVPVKGIYGLDFFASRLLKEGLVTLENLEMTMGPSETVGIIGRANSETPHAFFSFSINPERLLFSLPNEIDVTMIFGGKDGASHAATMSDAVHFTKVPDCNCGWEFGTVGYTTDNGANPMLNSEFPALQIIFHISPELLANQKEQRSLTILIPEILANGASGILCGV